MDLQLVTDSNEIVKLEEALASRIKKKCQKGRGVLSLSTRGGDGDYSDYYIHNVSGIWWCNQKGDNPKKHYNRFGINLKEGRKNNILIQINCQKKFSTFEEASVWAKDLKGDAYLLHSGRMGGGVSGITKENVDAYFNGNRVDLEHNGWFYEYYLVCSLKSTRAFEQLISFILEVKRVKEILKKLNETTVSRKANGGNKFELKDYTQEFWGRRKYSFSRRAVDSESDHGLVVDTLKEKLGRGWKFVKNKYLDLGIVKGKKPVAIFEVKTGTTRQMVYTAIGQLFFHAKSTKAKPGKYFVVPNTIDKKIIEDLESFDIFTIRYKWNQEKPEFLNLSEFF